MNMDKRVVTFAHYFRLSFALRDRENEIKRPYCSLEKLLIHHSAL